MAKPGRQVFLPLVAVCLLIGCKGAVISETRALYEGSGNDDQCPTCPESFTCQIERTTTADGNIMERYACLPNDTTTTSTAEETITTSIPAKHGKCSPNTNSIKEADVAIDFIIVIDQSRGLEKYSSWLATFAPYLNSELEAINIGSTTTCPNQYALVGFGNVDPLPIIYKTQNGSSLFSIFDFAEVSRNSTNTGVVEHGYLAMATALTDLPLRNSTQHCQVQRHLLLMTDEDNDYYNDSLTAFEMSNLLRKYRTYLHVIVDQRFFVGGFEGVGINVNGIAYKQSTTSEVCYHASADSIKGWAYARTDIQYTSIALQRHIGGSAWDTSRIDGEQWGRNALRCGLMQEIRARSKILKGMCYNCSCNSGGQEECQPVGDVPAKYTTCKSSLSIKPAQRGQTTVRQDRCPICPEHFSCEVKLDATADGSITEHFTCVSTLRNYDQCVPNTSTIAEADAAIDFIMVIDQSFHTKPYVSWLNVFVRHLSTKLNIINIGSTTTCPNQYAIVGFGNTNPIPAIYKTQSGSSLFSILDFEDVSKNLISSYVSWTRHGYLAITKALTDLPLRNSTRNCQVQRHLLIMTDYVNNECDGSVHVENSPFQMSSLLRKHQAYLHVMVNQSFFVNGSKGVGMNVNGVGYSKPTNGGACFYASADSRKSDYFPETNQDYTSVALQVNVAGTAWDIMEIRDLRAGAVIMCGLTQEIQTRSKLLQGVCFNCSCSSEGQERCQPAGDVTNKYTTCRSSLSIKTTQGDEIPRRQDRCPICPEHLSCGFDISATEDGNVKDQFTCVPDGSSPVSTTEEVISTPVPVFYGGQCVPHTNSVVAAQTAIDFIMVVDQSKSMKSYIDWLKSFVPNLNAELESKNIGSSATCPNQYGAIGFGNADSAFPKIYETSSGSALVSIREFAEISTNLNEKELGRTEYGYLSISTALTHLPLRNSTRRCVVQRHLLLLTDEDNDVSDEIVSRCDVEALLTKYHTYFHAIVDQTFTVNNSPGVGATSNGIGYKVPTNGDGCFNTSADFRIGKGFAGTRQVYTSLALQQNVGGTAWNILQLQDRAVQKATECALVHEIHARSSGTCFNCSCNFLGQEMCQPADGAVARQCACLHSNGLWDNGTCSFTEHSFCTPGSKRIRIAKETQNVAIEVILIVHQTVFNAENVENFISMISDINTGVLIKNVGRNSTCPNHVSLVGFGIKTDSTRNFARTIGLSIQDLDNATNVQLRKWQSGLGAFDAYQAMKFALDNVLLRPSSTPACKRSRHMILLTGADRKVESSETAYITKQHLIDRLLMEDIELHTVINSRFRIPDVEDILGRAGSVGYSQSHAADTCVEIHRKVENGAAYGQTNHDFTELALAVNGTAWDVYQLHSEPRRQAIACVLAAVTTSALIQPGEYCRTCICDDYGNFQCSMEASSNPGQCYCEYARGTWRDGVCQPNQDTPVTDLPAKQSSMTVAIAATAGAAGGCILLLLICGVLILRHSRTKSRDLDDLKAVHEAAPTRDLKSAAHHMMSMMVAPAGTRLKIIPTEALSFRRCIGKGQYGEVHLGHFSAKNSTTRGEEENDLVAIKIMRSSAGSDEAQRQLLEEYFLQESVGEYPNIVKVILGGLFKTEPCIVMEYMAGGDLLQFLRNVKGVNRLMHKGDDVPFLGDHEKLDISRQVALGLDFLSSKQIVHRDIAARNMLVREHKTIPGKLEVKISDWGLSRKAIADGAYQAQTSRMLPLKWMAIESIDTGSFSEKSDVWSFGVLMWEVETGGEVPYAHTPNALLLRLVQNGQRLEKPAHCSPFVYSLMLRCWEVDPRERPSFSDLSKELTGTYELETNYVVIFGEDEAAASSDSPSQDDTAPKNGTPTKPVGSALMSVFQRMRQETVDEEYMPMSPQIGEGQSDLANPQPQLDPEISAPRYVLGHHPPQLPSEESETPRHTPRACPLLDKAEQ